MSNLKFCLLIGLVSAVTGCGGGGFDNATSPSGSDLRLASETATVKPWDSAETIPAVSAVLSPAAPLKSGQVSTGTVSDYDPAALPIIGGEPSASSQWPAWRRGMARWQWTQVPGTDLSSIVPSPRPPGDLTARIDAWNGLAADRRTSILYSAANGGHADYSGNEVYQIDLSMDSPRWTILRNPTPESAIVASNYSATGIVADYYLDGRPASTHTYYSLQFLPSRNAVFKFGAGSLWGGGGESNWKTDAFSLTSNDWHPANTWPDVVPGGRTGVIGAPVCVNPETDEVYIAAPGNLKRFDPATGTYAVLAAWPADASGVQGRACAVDSSRKRVMFFGDGHRLPSGGLVYDIVTNAFSRIDFTGDGAADALIPMLHYAWFEPRVGQYLLKTAVADRVYAIDPDNFGVRMVGTLGGAAMPNGKNGVNTRWQRLPNLGGYAYYPAYGGGIWFLAVE